jgi:hypothetical protein
VTGGYIGALADDLMDKFIIDPKPQPFKRDEKRERMVEEAARHGMGDPR